MLPSVRQIRVPSGLFHQILQIVTRTGDGRIIPIFFPLDRAFIEQNHRILQREGCSLFNQRLQHSLVFIDLLAYQPGTLVRKILELSLFPFPE
ncbi:MAG: hypothetical protein AB7S66_11865 [Sphaerochaeta sp.]